jgi:hypothetical protein
MSVTDSPPHVHSVFTNQVCPLLPATGQPDYVSWYVDGKLLRSDRQGARIGNTGRTFQVPRRPMRPTFSLWTDMRRPNAFGGEIKPWEGPWRATWNRMRQVVCDRPAPASTPLGPSWMYA